MKNSLGVDEKFCVGANFIWMDEHQKAGHEPSQKSEAMEPVMISELIETNPEWVEKWPNFVDMYEEMIEDGESKEFADWPIQRSKQWVACSCGDFTEADEWTQLV